jgi:branched-subunit amino acid ABC-type transport system permease component
MDVDIIVEAFIVVVIGGLGSFWGTFLGALGFGRARFRHPDPAGLLDFAVFALMALVLVVRPFRPARRPQAGKAMQPSSSSSPWAA